MHISRRIPGRIPGHIHGRIPRRIHGSHPSEHGGTTASTTAPTSTSSTTTNALHLNARCHRPLLTRKFPKFSLTAVKFKLASDSSWCRCRDKHRRGTARSPPTVDRRAASTMTRSRSRSRSRPRSRSSRDATRLLLRFPHAIVRLHARIVIMIVIVVPAAIRRTRTRAYT